MRIAAYIGVAKKLYDEAPKPESQHRITHAVAAVRERRTRPA
jgi:hypothetical protein